MYHEILVSLYGFSGGFLEKFKDVANLDTFIHPGEKSLLIEILDVAAEHKTLKDFIELYKRDPCVFTPLLKGEDSSRSLQPGLYLEALCIGLDEALEPYREEIIQMEKRFLADPHCTLTYVLTKINPHYKVLMALNALVREIMVCKLHGCQLLQLLYQNLSTPIDTIKTALLKIRKRCHVVFFKQLSSWVLHGQLKDSFHEFFIKESLESSDSASLSVQEYQLSADMLPSYIPLNVASKILFVGQTIVMMCNNPRDRETDNSSIQQLEKTDIDTILQNHIACQYFERLNKLQHSSHFDVGLFEETIEITHSCVTEHLWDLAINQAELPVQMRLIKDVFLLGRGELFLEFIKQAEPLLDRAPSSNFSKDINQAFHTAARMILLSSEEAKMDKFYFSASDQSAADDAEANGWTLLVLHYRVTWPLHLIFSPAVLDSYNQLFGFLLRVKRTQLQLHNLWRLQMVTKSKRWEDSRLWEIRTWLMFIVDHLQYYLQVDVLESQWINFENALKSPKKDFEAVKHAHMNFLISTLSQTFLLLGHAQNEPSFTSYQKQESLKNNPVHNSISRLLHLCEKFCGCVALWGDKHLSVDEEDDLTQLCRELEHLVQFLLQLLSSLRSQPCGTHLAKLLLRLDFNRWFSTHCTGSSLTGSFTGSFT